MADSFPRRHSVFAFWRWSWRVWVVLLPLTLIVYVVSAPLAYFIANECVRTNSRALWMISDAVWGFYYPVAVLGQWYQPLADFIDWEYGKIKQFFYPYSF
jgi:hypothetical protein